MDDKAIAVCRQKEHLSVTRFQKLCAQVEATVREKQELEASLDLLVVRIQSEVLPMELATAEVSQQVLERLLYFSERSSLSQRRRIALTPWMDELMLYLLDVVSVEDALRNRMARHHAMVLNVALDPDSSQSLWSQFECYLEQQILQERRCGCEFQHGDEPLPESVEAAGSTYFCGAEQDDDSSRELADGLNVAVFQRLFRQTAAALHPDKEADEQKRCEKHVLMTRLLQARKDHDLLTLMQLHERYTVAGNPLSDADERQLEGVLQRYLSVLEKQKAALSGKSFLHDMAYRWFHDDDSELIDARIASYIASLEQRQHTLLTFLAEVRTLKQLQVRLPLGHDLLYRLW